MVAANHGCKLSLKAFHSEIINDHQGLKKERGNYVSIPEIRKLGNGIVQRNYLKIKQDAGHLSGGNEKITEYPAQKHEGVIDIKYEFLLGMTQMLALIVFE